MFSRCNVKSMGTPCSCDVFRSFVVGLKKTHSASFYFPAWRLLKKWIDFFKNDFWSILLKHDETTWMIPLLSFGCSPWSSDLLHGAGLWSLHRGHQGAVLPFLKHLEPKQLETYGNLWKPMENLSILSLLKISWKLWKQVVTKMVSCQVRILPLGYARMGDGLDKFTWECPAGWKCVGFVGQTSWVCSCATLRCFCYSKFL